MQTILKWYVRIVMLLFPVFFLPVVTDGFGLGKNWFLGSTALVGLGLWVAEILITKKNVVRVNKPFWLVLALTVWAGIGWARLGPGVQTRTLMTPNGWGTLVALLIWFFLWLQVNDKDERGKQLWFLSVSGILVAVSSLIIFLIPASKMPILLPKNNPILSISQGWSLVGSLIGEAVFLLLLVCEWVKRLLSKLRNKENNQGYIVEAVMTAVFGLIMFLDIYRLVTTGLVILDNNSSWVIAVETLKRSPFFGVGLGNFIEAFNLYRPVQYNLTQYWANGFNTSSMGILNLWTELGIVGLFLMVMLFSCWVRLKRKGDYWIVGLFLVLLAVLPMNMMILFLAVWLLAGSLFETKEIKLVLNIGENNMNISPWVLSVVLTAGIVYGGINWVKILRGEIYMRNSYVASSLNNGGLTYDLQIKAKGQNNYYAEYRRVFSQVNLGLAQAILSNKEVTEEDKQKASTLIQQSVTEAKSAIALDGSNPVYWTNLAAIYKALVGVVEGAPDWSFQASQQAAILDPVNPLIKLDIGWLLFASGRYDEADRVFEQVVTNKPDYANGWYNWAYTAKNSNKLADAVQRLSQAVALVPVDSGDYDKALKELTTWKKELDEAIKKQAASVEAAKQAETLKTPGPLPTPGKVTIPNGEMEPPKVTPRPTAVEEANPTVQPAP